MGDATAIEWADATFNPWRGCARVSPGCVNCYAEALATRFAGTLGTWGPGGERAMASEAYWRKPERWNAEAAAAGVRRRVFCASLADVFEDRPDLEAPRARLFDLIVATPHLDWLLLTKRPENVRRLATAAAASLGLLLDEFMLAPNVWLGTTVEDQARADERVPILLDTPAAVRFLSCEPLLGPVDLSEGLWLGPRMGPQRTRVDWLIVGGESGPHARSMDLAWARTLVEQGRAAGVPVFVKQLGARPYVEVKNGAWLFGAPPLRDPRPMRDRKGGDPDEWPADLRVREVPA